MDPGGAYDHKWALKYDECIIWFKSRSMNPFPDRLSCNATWDGILCWPAIPAGTKYTQLCPEEDGFNTNNYVTKQCSQSGRWVGKDKYDFSLHQGWTDYSPCYVHEVNIGSILWYVGLSLSIFAIAVILVVLSCSRSRRWRLNQARIGFLAALLLMYIVRLSLHADEELVGREKNLIFDKQPICEVFIAIMEFVKLLAGGWLAVTCFHGLFETISERRAEHCLGIVLYATAAFVYAIVTTVIWLCVLLLQDNASHFVCFGPYKYNGTLSAYVLVYGNLVLLAIAMVGALAHAGYALLKRVIFKTSRFAGIRWFVQSIIHTVICACLLAVWYYDLWLKSRHAPDDEVLVHYPYIDIAIVAFAGLVVSALIGLAQCCLPAKETMRL